MGGLKVGGREEGVEEEMISTRERDVVRLELNKEEKNVQDSALSEEEKEISMTIEAYIIWEQEFFTKFAMLFL